MSKAEDLAEKAYPQEMDGYCENNAAMRVGFKIGYHQAEKDLALSWEDMMRIWAITEEVPDMAEEDFYKEVLRRFNEERNKV